MGPSVNAYNKILELIDAGMNVARLNFSHGTQEEHAHVIDMLKKARKEKGVPLAIMLDTKGPEIRIGAMQQDQINLKEGQKLLLVKEVVVGDASRVHLTPVHVLDVLEKGMRVLFDDGYIQSHVVETSGKGVLVEIENAGVLKSHKGVNVLNVDLQLPAMTEQDVKDIAFGCAHDVDIIAASFIRSAEHVLAIKRLIVEHKKSEIIVIAKIENYLGIHNFDSILMVADGIMVARGDLGVELPLKEVPKLQKMMIRKCYQAAKPVITATQMLESMIKNPRPTRAEVSDVFNAICDSTTAVMLSGETAVGSYPIETVTMMKNIIEEAEKDFHYREFFLHNTKAEFNDVSQSIALATVNTAFSTGAKGIFVFTDSGMTARFVSRFRPEMPIIALTPHHKIYNQLALNWGIIPADPLKVKNAHEAFIHVCCFALRKGVVRYGDLVIVTAGEPFGVRGTTNMLFVESIGDVLVRGHPRSGRRIHGKVTLIHSPEEKKQQSVHGKIAVISRCDESYLPLIQHALGIVLQNSSEDAESEKNAIKIAKMLDIPLLMRSDGAMSLLQEEQHVTLDPERGIVYKGSITSDEEMIPSMCKM
jgi:pyruvate kinase